MSAFSPWRVSACALFCSSLLSISSWPAASPGSDRLPALKGAADAEADETPEPADVVNQPVDERDVNIEKPAARPPHLIVVRISNRMLAGLIDKPIEVTTKVRDEILDTPLTGTAEITGRIGVGLAPSKDQARFSVTCEGNVLSKTIGRNGPAVIHGHSVTNFTATKEVVFEPGRGFYALPAKVNADTQCFNDSVESTRGGVLGRVVQRRATKKLEENHDEITKIARQRAVTGIATAIERHLDQRLAQLNQAIQMRATLVKLRDEQPVARLTCRTTKNYLEIADAGPDGQAPIELPVYTSASASSAPIEIWVHRAIVPPRLALVVETLLTTPQDSLVMSVLNLLPGAAGKDACAAVAAFVHDNHVGMQQLGEWVVFEVNTQPSSTLIADAPTLRR